MSSRTAIVWLAGMELRLGATLDVHTARERPGEQEITGNTDGTPDIPALRSQLADAGFTLVTDFAAGGSDGFSLVAQREATVIVINFSGAPWNALLLNATDHEAVPRVEVTRGAFVWSGVEWPAYFVDGRITYDTTDSIVIEADVEDSATIDRYQQWARANGFELEDPPGVWEHEPDLRVAHGAGFRNPKFEVRVGIDGGRLTLFITTRRASGREEGLG